MAIMPVSELEKYADIKISRPKMAKSISVDMVSKVDPLGG